jgi:gentisate 1,2-dioxygenase
VSQEPLPQSIADLPVQRPASPKSSAESRARYFNTGNAFNQAKAPVPARIFTEEPAKALSPASPTGFFECDTSKELGCAFMATTPWLLVRYARIRAGESLRAELSATGVIAYVIEGAGGTQCGAERFEWSAGDIFVLPGGVPQIHHAGAGDAVLWIVTNEPLLALENLRPPAPGNAPTDAVHYRADDIARQIGLLYQVGRGQDIAGSALILSSDRQEENRNVLPTLLVGMNSLPGGGSQRPHRHNSVAVTLVIQGERCHSIVDGQRIEWSPWATTITPAVAVHSHYNEGRQRAMFLIVQDSGFYSHARTMGFQFSEE